MTDADKDSEVYISGKSHMRLDIYIKIKGNDS